MIALPGGVIDEFGTIMDKAGHGIYIIEVLGELHAIFDYNASTGEFSI